MTVKLFGGCCLAACFALPAFADDAATALMRRSDERIRAADEQVTYRMELAKAGETTFVRDMVRLDKRMGDRKSTLVRFSAPQAVKNVGLLIEDRGEAANDIWSYTPSTRSLRRLAGSQKQNWFMGTDFTYEDFEDYKLPRHDFSLVGTAQPCLAWAACQQVEARPKADEAGASGYARKVYYIEQASLYPVQVDYYGADGRLAKQLKADALKTQDGFPRPTAQTMFNLLENKSTRLVTVQDQINPGLADSQFSQRALRTEH